MFDFASLCVSCTIFPYSSNQLITESVVNASLFLILSLALYTAVRGAVRLVAADVSEPKVMMAKADTIRNKFGFDDMNKKSPTIMLLLTPRLPPIANDLKEAKIIYEGQQ